MTRRATSTVPWYALTLVLHDEFLLEMARVIGAEYVPGSFDAAERELLEGDHDFEQWEMRGEHGRFVVSIERYEGYLSCSLGAQEPWFREGRELMWERYVAAGGNPAAVRPP